MKILRKQKQYAYAGQIAKKITSDEAIRKGVAREVKKSTEWIKSHPLKPGLLHTKTVKKSTWFLK